MNPDYRAGMMHAAKMLDDKANSFTESVRTAENLDSKLCLINGAVALLTMSNEITKTVKSHLFDDPAKVES